MTGIESCAGSRRQGHIADEKRKRLDRQATPDRRRGRSLAVKTAWLDGEVVALLRDGRVSFQTLQNAFDTHSDSNLVYFVFDLLYLDGYDLRPASLIERKRLLSALFQDSSPTDSFTIAITSPARGRRLHRSLPKRHGGLIAKRAMLLCGEANQLGQGEVRAAAGVRDRGIYRSLRLT